MNDVDLAAEREASRRRERSRKLSETLPRLLLGQDGAASATRVELRSICLDRYGSTQIQGEVMTDGELDAVVDRALQLREESRGRRLDPAEIETLAPARTEDMERAMPRDKKGSTKPKLSPQEREELKEWIREQLPTWEGSTADLWRACPFDLPITDKTFFYYVAQIQKEMEAAGAEQDTKRVAAEEEQEKPTAPRDDAAVVAGMPAAPRALNGNGGPPRVHVGQRSDGRYEVYLDTLDAGLAYRVAAAASLLVSDEAA